MSTLFVVNPRAGAGRGREIAEQLEGACRDGRIAGAVTLLTGELDTELLSRYTDLIIAGGDGTVSKLVTNPALANIPIGIIPLGTANDLAREFGMLARFKKIGLLEYITELRNCPTRTNDLWELSFDNAQSFRFANYASFGFDGVVVSRFEEWRRARLDRGARCGAWINRYGYLSSALRSLSVQFSAALQVECAHAAEACTARGLVFSNISSYMGIARFSALSDPSDRRIEVRWTSSLLDYAAMILAWRGCLDRRTQQVGECGLADLPARFALQVDGESYVVSGARSARIAHHGSIELRYFK